MAMLTDEIKAEIVLRLAQFSGYSEVARAIESEFGVAVDRHQVRTYDPSKPAFAAAERWRSFFNEARTRYLDDVTAVPIANKAFRLNELQRSFELARRSGNLILANATLRQAAEEVGGSLTNESKFKVLKGAEELTQTSAARRLPR